jgi:hypothetical protein
MHLTLTADAAHATTSSASPHGISTGQSGTEQSGRTQLRARPFGWTGARGRECVREGRDGSRLTASSMRSLSAGRRRGRRDMGLLLTVRRAEQGRAPLGGGGRGRS